MVDGSLKILRDSCLIFGEEFASWGIGIAETLVVSEKKS